MKRLLPGRLTLRTKLVISCAGVGVLVAALLLLGNQIIRDAATRLESVLTTQVRPLAQINRLQAHISRIRVLEVELPRLTDLFAVSDQLELLNAETEAFDRDFATFLAGLKVTSAAEASGLEGQWRRYQADLKTITAHAHAMELGAAQRVSTFESAGRFKAITRILRQLAESTEAGAGSAFAEAVARHGSQRTLFVATSAVGLLVFVVWIGLLARSVSGRVSDLRNAAMQVAEGRRDSPIALLGNDELADLGAAFNTMQEKVRAREEALRDSQIDMEYRVQARTSELYDANEQLKREIEERMRAEEGLNRLSQAVEQSPASIMITDAEGRIEYVNQAFVDGTGYERGEVMGENPFSLLAEDAGCAATSQAEQRWAALLQCEAQHGEMQAHRRDGSRFWVHLQASPLHDAGGAVRHFLVAAEDVTLRKDQEQRILHQAQHDSLTELPNRMLALDRLSQAILHAQRAQNHVVLIFLDLDDFKRVNDSLGHHMGDALLVQAAARLRQTVRAEDTVARQGGDEFLIIISGLTSPHDADAVAEKIVESFAPSFRIGESDVVVTPSLGLAVYPFDGEDPETLLRNADLAMYDAKESGRNAYRYFNQKVHESSVMRLAIEHRLRGALQRGELRLFYQPLVATTTRRLLGAEALLRWQSPDYGLVAPDHFMAVAEHTGLIVEIGDWVLAAACAQARRWRDCGWTGFRIGVNVSPRQFRGRRLLNTLRDCVSKSGIPPGCLQIEVTEGLLIRNQPEVREILGALNAEGVLLALDDFGTGYSSLSYLKRFPFDILKIDREFVRDLATDPDDRALVTAAIRMGKGLGLIVVAEGVETEEQLAILAEQECDVIQGFVIGEPVDAAQFEERWVAPLLAVSGQTQ